MKTEQLHTLIRQHIPQITYLETDTSESAEGEWTIWQQEDCTIIIEFADKPQANEQFISTLQTLSAQLNWLEQHRADVMEILTTQTNLAETASIQMVYLACLIEHHEVFCDFAISADALRNQVAEFSLEPDGELIFNGLERN